MPKITVVTATIRPQYLNLTYECLKKQTFKDFEWLREELVSQFPVNFVSIK